MIPFLLAGAALISANFLTAARVPIAKTLITTRIKQVVKFTITTDKKRKQEKNGKILKVLEELSDNTLNLQDIDSLLNSFENCNNNKTSEENE